jgi:hypothetical protein
MMSPHMAHEHQDSSDELKYYGIRFLKYCLDV